ncbi:hypothetical protein BDV23DRAFT_46265 [Aspergillus alliaceus]|uniref:Uncharacterized protein n=1 Tax=Petromyces alliaceus TaxID=209559 RepID=A0A5N7CRN8_PETAA|nr:uncharacterized protein BDW43DRAFT_19838 [Aspergillus alliaceus]KAB8236060.1 hypothetical protein BDW43DRAFT_19838 [Aspergillus alliaceus]KAE8396233.1 hypothetical protein BDV23DRAFT_46265 [Aspergillus alliaceus]
MPVLMRPVFVFALTFRDLNPTIIITSLAYLQLLSGPFSTLFQVAPQQLSAFSCHWRILLFSERDPRHDFSPTRRDRHILKGNGFRGEIAINYGNHGCRLWLGNEYVDSEGHQCVNVSRLENYCWSRCLREINTVQSIARRDSNCMRRSLYKDQVS